MRFRSDPARIRGSIAPVVSPFTADGLPDLESLRGLVRWQLESGSHGISLGGSTGEPSAQSTAERATAIVAGYVRPPLVPLSQAGQATALALLRAGAPVLEGPVAQVAM
jgi:dihydrodipicolinate synthase/N-acetylneuraminate lyase